MVNFKEEEQQLHHKPQHHHYKKGKRKISNSNEINKEGKKERKGEDNKYR